MLQTYENNICSSLQTLSFNFQQLFMEYKIINCKRTQFFLTFVLLHTVFYVTSKSRRLSIINDCFLTCVGLSETIDVYTYTQRAIIP